MTDGISMALASQQYSLLQTQTPPDVAPMQQPAQVQANQLPSERYDAPLPPGREADFKPVMDLAAKVSEQMQTVMNSHTAIAAETAEAFPQLRAMENMFQQVREFSLVEFQFDLLGKSLQLAESNVRQLYQQQG